MPDEKMKLPYKLPLRTVIKDNHTCIQDANDGYVAVLNSIDMAKDIVLAANHIDEAVDLLKLSQEIVNAALKLHPHSETASFAIKKIATFLTRIKEAQHG